MTKEICFPDLILHHALPCLLLLLLGISISASKVEDYQTYIIHMDHSHKPASFLTHESWHRSVLKSLSYPADEEEMLLYSYNHVIHGFSARLTALQLSEIEKSPAHLATYPESFGKLFTTHSPKFLGLKSKSGLWPAASYGEGIIIGIIDTGIWPESDSFSDNGMPPVPERWKGQCENGTAFSPSACNKKLIGARSFSKGLKAAGRNISSESDYDSARDFFGHGTHTSSTAAVNHVLGVSQFGYARGTARGVAPRAHIAMYKVLWETDTLKSAASDVLAGMDQAITDGVDIMSLSLGFDQTPFFKDVIAIGSLSAIQKGTVVVCAAGISYYPESIYIVDAPLYYGKGNVNKTTCNMGALNPDEVSGKVILCDNGTIDVYGQMMEVNRVGAHAAIFLTDTSDLDAEDYSIPSLTLPTSYGILIREYVTGWKKPMLKRMKFVLTEFGTKPAPQVASFSSRGPDSISPGILKPDILAPGVDVLAAVAPNIPYMEIGNYDLVTDYALYSGTSMAAPHVAGVAALLKAVHKDWSPAAVRSAIMTTAYTIDNTGTILKDENTGLPATPLEFGAGHINPNKAMDPGLIYEINFQDYVEFLCGIGYDEKQIKIVLRQSKWNCSQVSTDLNYPSFVAIITNETVKSFSRVVTNVGEKEAVYHAILDFPTGMKIRTEPSTLTFTDKYQKQGFVLSVEIDGNAPGVIYGYLKWIDQHNHIVSSPVVVIKT
ncbi:hypothetical protein EZV62_021603 [Acer yangbiense]|uniref:Subtilisin-like protease fibronectin type-III domain-containing protein n=1 Tax=Acer yangbiense TaxID=1000413 RepID=A0A5C7H625_9ROSI|nr:hypothetical protein EZV62_021603 [Acer yangbiense]